VWDFLIAVVGPVAALCGVAYGAWLNGRREERKRRLEFQERQLREFYGPLWFNQLRIRTLKEIQARLDGASVAQYDLLVTQLEGQLPETIARQTKEYLELFQADKPYQVQEIATDVASAYEKILTIFEGSLGLADPDTLDWLPMLIQFVETKKRPAGLHPAVAKAVDVKEDQIGGFFEHVDLKYQQFAIRLRQGTPNKKLPSEGGQQLPSHAVVTIRESPEPVSRKPK
jgi:hypothetical protein